MDVVKKESNMEVDAGKETKVILDTYIRVKIEVDAQAWLYAHTGDQLAFLEESFKDFDYSDLLVLQATEVSC